MVHRQSFAVQREWLYVRNTGGVGRSQRQWSLYRDRPFQGWRLVGHGTRAVRLSALVARWRRAETTLLLYQDSHNTDALERSLNGYQHPDQWEGGAWITTASGKSAVLFAGTKSNGARYWHGFINPAGAQYPCVHGESVGQFPVCRLADGAPCPPADLIECADHTSQRGWWSTRFDAQFTLYDPADLARVAAGERESWQPQPYAVL